MAMLIVRDIPPSLVARLREQARERGCTLQSLLMSLLAQETAIHTVRAHPRELDLDVLEEAAAALREVPADPGFGLIGRAPPPPPKLPNGPEQRIGARWTQDA